MDGGYTTVRVAGWWVEKESTLFSATSTWEINRQLTTVLSAKTKRKLPRGHHPHFYCRHPCHRQSFPQSVYLSIYPRTNEWRPTNRPTRHTASCILLAIKIPLNPPPPPLPPNISRCLPPRFRSFRFLFIPMHSTPIGSSSRHNNNKFRSNTRTTSHHVAE